MAIKTIYVNLLKLVLLTFLKKFLILSTYSLRLNSNNIAIFWVQWNQYSPIIKRYFVTSKNYGYENLDSSAYYAIHMSEI